MNRNFIRYKRNKCVSQKGLWLSTFHILAVLVIFSMLVPDSVQADGLLPDVIIDQVVTPDVILGSNCAIYSTIVRKRLAKLKCRNQIPGICYGPIKNAKGNHVGVLIYWCEMGSKTGWVVHGTPNLSRWGRATSSTGHLYLATIENWNMLEGSAEPECGDNATQRPLYFGTGNYPLSRDSECDPECAGKSMAIEKDSLENEALCCGSPAA